jgi:hypothetical protein
MKIMFVKDLAEARREMKKMLAPKMAIVFRNYNDKTLAAWVPDGYSSGYLVTRNDLKKNPNLSFSHNHGGSQGAFEELKHDVLFKKEILRCSK